MLNFWGIGDGGVVLEPDGARVSARTKSPFSPTCGTMCAKEFSFSNPKDFSNRPFLQITVYTALEVVQTYAPPHTTGQHGRRHIDAPEGRSRRLPLARRLSHRVARRKLTLRYVYIYCNVP